MTTTNTLPLSAIETIFHDAAKRGFKKPSLRAAGLKFSLATETGRNKGSVYVTQNIEGTYLGKITAGRLFLLPGVPAVYHGSIENIMALPLAHAIRYGHQTGSCSICGRRLDNAISVAMGIGPICAEKLGLDVAMPPVDTSML